MSVTLLDALGALRDAEDASAPSLGWAWRAISDHLDRRHRRPEREHADVRQRTLLKVWRGLALLEADTPSAAEAWLRTVHRSAVVEHHRGTSTREMDRALRATPADDAIGFVDRAGAVDVDREPRARASEGALDAALDAVLERVDAWLETAVSRPAKRHGDRLRAQAAILANVRGLDAEAIATALGSDLARTAIYKWVERGRERVLLPALEDWDHPAAAAFREHLVGCRRADAGAPRPDRHRSVSRGGGPASVPMRPRKKKRRKA